MTHYHFRDAILSLPNIQVYNWPKVSPDGRWVAWTWFQIGPAANVYAAPTDGSAAPIRLTATADDTWLSCWLNDSSGVLVEQDKDGNERAQLFRVNLDQPLEMIPLTEPDPNFYLRSPRMHPNGRWLVYGANFDVTTGKEINQTWVYRHDLETGERVPLAKPNKSGPTMPELNSLGTHILYTRKDLHPAGRQVWLVDIEGDNDCMILDAGPDKKATAHWFPDGLRAVVLAENQTHVSVGAWELESRQLNWLLDDPLRDMEDAFVPYGSSDLVLVENIQGRTRASFMAIDGSKEISMPRINGNLIPLAPAQEQEWIGLHYSSKQPTDIVRFSLADPDPQKFISLSRVWQHTELTPNDFTPAENFRWRSSDGLEIHGWLYRPANHPKGTIIYVHGGPTWHSRDWINEQIQFFLHCGFNVLDPNYRGSTGYGLPFCQAIRQDGWGGREQEDIRTGIEALISVGITQPGKVGITGTSYGGYSSWFAITKFPPEVITAAAPICGMTDLVVDYETTRPDIRPYSEEMMGGSPTQVPERYFDRSPINFIKDIRGRLLIVQGEQDPNVTPENVRLVEQALKKAGILYEKLIFADEGHGISKPTNQKILFERLLSFFEEAFAAQDSISQ